MPDGAPIWRVRLFYGPVLEDAEGREIARFRSEKVQGLLSYLALRLGRRCTREELADALWPDERDGSVVANRLRVTLASLRRQLEPPPVVFGSVLDASLPGVVRLREEAVWCDVAAFEKAYASGDQAKGAALLRGPLLPGLYDEWVRDEQLRFEILREQLSGLAKEPEPTKPAAAPPLPAHRLPLYLTRFVGRESERDRLAALLKERRLVTLTGPGGIGKTRLAVEAAAATDKPATFVSLAGVLTVQGVAEAILAALGIASRVGSDAIEQTIEVLREKSANLLVLDNAEDDVSAVADTTVRLLAALPELRTLVTSRQRLEVPGEVTFAVPPLVPPAETTALEDLLAYPAVTLFLDRAQNAVPDFVLSERHREAVVAICRRLEGMPLALELAAARLAVQSPNGILAALEANLIDLRSRQRGLSERHRSLRAAIQGSVEILTPELASLFARLAVFRGGWTVEAAAEVCGEPRSEERLEELFVRSLVTVREDDQGTEVRYAFLEPLRAFAAERLDGEGDTYRLRHAAYYLRLAARVTEDDLRTLEPLDAEEENLRLAIEAGRDDPAFWPGLAGALLHAFVRGKHRQALRWIEATMEEVGSISDLQARFRWRYAAAQILPDVGWLDATETIALAMRADAKEAGDERAEVYAEVILGYVEEMRGDPEGSLERTGRALERARVLSDRHLLETVLSHRSGTLHVVGAGERDSERGRAMLKEAEQLAIEMRLLVPAHSRRLALAPLLLAGALWSQGRLAEAVDAFKLVQATAVRLGTSTELMYAFISEAVIAAGWGYFEHAATLYGAFGALQERMGYSLDRAQSSRPPWILSTAEELRSRLGETRFRALVAEGGKTPAAVLAERRVKAP